MMAISHKNFYTLLFICTVFFVSTTLNAAPKFVDGTYLIVNTQMLTYSEFQEALASFQEQIKLSKASEEAKKKSLENLEQQVLIELRNELLLLDRATTLKIEATPQEITQRMTQIENNNPSFFKAYPEFELRVRIAKEIKKQRLLGREVNSKVRVSEEEIVDFCTKQQKENRSLELSQILIRRSLKEAEQIQKQVTQAVERGQSFAMLAMQYSDDPAVSSNGGKLGVFKKGELLKSINDAAFRLKKGELTPLIKSSFGYHIVYIDEEHQLSKGNCTELSAQVRRSYSSAIFAQKRKVSLKEYIKKLQASAKIIIHTPPVNN